MDLTFFASKNEAHVPNSSCFPWQLGIAHIAPYRSTCEHRTLPFTNFVDETGGSQFRNSSSSFDG